VREFRRPGSERLIEEDLLRRVRDVIVAADHVADRHLHIVDDDREMVGGLAVRSQDHEVLDVGVLEHDRSTHEIAEGRPAGRNFEADGARCPGRLARGHRLSGQRAARAVVHPSAAGGFRCLAFQL
jgi:hypothetical protein